MHLWSILLFCCHVCYIYNFAYVLSPTALLLFWQGDGKICSLLCCSQQYWTKHYNNLSLRDMESYGESVPFVTFKGMFHELKLKIERYHWSIPMCIATRLHVLHLLSYVYSNCLDIDPNSWKHTYVDKLSPRQNGHHFPDDFFKCIFLNENIWILIKMSIKFIPKVPSNNIPTLVPKMTWRRQGDKQLSEPMMASLQTHICVTRPQLVNKMFHWNNWWLIVLIGAYTLPKSKRNYNQLDP